jgi:aminopeptidase N
VKNIRYYSAASLLALSFVNAAYAAEPLASSDAKPAESVPAVTVDKAAPDTAVPLRYVLTIEPDIKNFTFNGQTVINMELSRPTDVITLNARDLKFTSAKINPIDKPDSVIDLGFTFNTANETVDLKSTTLLPAGKYDVRIVYDGLISTTDSVGLFAVDTRDTKSNNADIRSAWPEEIQIFTDSEPNDARRIFPGFDHPKFRTPFQTELILPATSNYVGNMREQSKSVLPSGKQKVVFEPTPAMSTYLLFFGAGKFERYAKTVDGVDYGIVVRPKPATESAIALDSLPRITRWFGTYFDKPYALKKMDVVASAKPMVGYIAMENWGAILSQEDAVLFKASWRGNNKDFIIYVNAHEIAHQWVGNLVTPASWLDLWLSEGLASFLTTKILRAEFKIEDPVLGDPDTRNRLLTKDNEVYSRSLIDMSLKDSYSVSDNQGEIVYDKGNAIFTMAEETMGADKWQNILRRYVKKYSDGNVTTNSLLEIVREDGEAGTAASLKDFGENVGFPLVTVNSASCSNGKMTLQLSQTAYPKRGAVGSSKTWNIPLFIRGNGLNEDAKIHYLSGKTGSVELASCGAVTLNNGDNGYYRVDYGPAMKSAALFKTDALSPNDQMGMLIDSFANTQVDGISAVTALDMLTTLKFADDKKMQDYAIERYGELLDAFRNSPATLKQIQALIRNRLGPIYEKKKNAGLSELAWDEDAYLNILDRAGYAGLYAEATKRIFNGQGGFLDHKYGNAIWYKIFWRNLKIAEWNKRLASSDIKKDPGLSDYIGLNQHPTVFKKAMDFAMALPEDYKAATILEGLADEYPDALLKTLSTDKKWQGKLSYFLSGTALKAARKASTLQAAAYIEALAKNETDQQSKYLLSTAAQEIRRRQIYFKKLRAEIQPWLSAQLKQK